MLYSSSNSLTLSGRLAQLARASDLHSEGRGFEPLIAHQIYLQIRKVPE